MVPRPLKRRSRRLYLRWKVWGRKQRGWSVPATLIQPTSLLGRYVWFIVSSPSHWLTCLTHCMWFAYDLRVTCMWFACDLHVICIWPAHDLHVTCTWFACDFDVLGLIYLITVGYCCASSPGPVGRAEGGSPDPHGCSEVQTGGVDQAASVLERCGGGVGMAEREGGCGLVWWLWKGLWAPPGKCWVWPVRSGHCLCQASWIYLAQNKCTCTFCIWFASP